MQRPRPSSRLTAKPLADVMADILSPALAAQGFAGREVVARWGEIVGERLAGRSRPQKIEWPRRRPGGEGQQAGISAAAALIGDEAVREAVARLGQAVLRKRMP